MPAWQLNEREQKVKRIPTGVDNLDLLLNGGLPEDSITIITGAPGTGKTILTLNILFNSATRNQRAFYFTTVSEPATKVLKYQQKFSFFDQEKFNSSVLFIDLGSTIERIGLQRAFELVKEKILQFNPRMIAIDSFKAISDLVDDKLEFRGLVHELSIQLSIFGCTALFVGEYTKHEIGENAEFAVADGVINLEFQNHQIVPSRVIQILKMRGTDFVEGDHSYRITKNGISVFPRLMPYPDLKIGQIGSLRISSGIPTLDEMLDGGFIPASSTMITGSAGTGKTLFGIHFLHEGLKSGEKALFVSITESQRGIMRIASGCGMPIEEFIESGQLTFLHQPPTGLNVHYLCNEIQKIVDERKVSRVVFDAISDICPNFQQELDLRDYVFSMINLFERHDICSIFINGIRNDFGKFTIAEANLAGLVDSIILLRYIEIHSKIEKAISIIKARGNDHDRHLNRFKITRRGIEISKTFSGYSNLMFGCPIPGNPGHKKN